MLPWHHFQVQSDENKLSELNNNQSSSIGKHNRDKHSIVLKDLDKQFTVLKKRNNNFDCLVYEMLLIRELTPSLNVQSDSIFAKLFAWHSILLR